MKSRSSEVEMLAIPGLNNPKLPWVLTFTARVGQPMKITTDNVIHPCEINYFLQLQINKWIAWRWGPIFTKYTRTHTHSSLHMENYIKGSGSGREPTECRKFQLQPLVSPAGLTNTYLKKSYRRRRRHWFFTELLDVMTNCIWSSTIVAAPAGKVQGERVIYSFTAGIAAKLQYHPYVSQCILADVY